MEAVEITALRQQATPFERSGGHSMFRATRMLCYLRPWKTVAAMLFPRHRMGAARQQIIVVFSHPRS